MAFEIIPPFDLETMDDERSLIWHSDYYRPISGFHYIKPIFIEIPSWDMDNLDQITVPLELIQRDDVMFMFASIIPDGSTDPKEFTLAILEVNVTIDPVLQQIKLSRKVGGHFDSPIYSDANVRRGDIVLILR